MSRIRLIVLSLLAVFAVGGVASASASAEVCQGENTGTEINLCIMGEEATGNPAIESEKEAATVSELKIENGPTIVCEKAKNTGQFEMSSDPGIINEISDVRITFSECKVTSDEEHCEIAGSIIVDGGEGKGTGDNLDGTVLSATEIEFKPSEPTKAKELFTIITIKSKPGKACAAAGAYNVTGKQKCKLIGTPEREELEHDLECNSKELEAAKKPATFKLTEDIELTSHKTWSVRKVV